MGEMNPAKSQPIIRMAERADGESVLHLLSRQFAEHGIAPPSRHLDQAIGQFLLDERWGFILVAREAQEIIGVACVPFAMTLEHGGKSAWLDELYVIPERRGQGVGTALLRHALQVAKERGCAAMDLEVETTHQRAERLYRREGFTPLTRKRWARKL